MNGFVDIKEIIPLLEDLPCHICSTIAICSGDVEGGYGWHRWYHVKVIEVGQRCEKCGLSTITGGDEYKHPFNNHRWNRHEVVRIFKKVELGRELEELKEEIELLKKSFEK